VTGPWKNLLSRAPSSTILMGYHFDGCRLVVRLRAAPESRE